MAHWKNTIVIDLLGTTTLAEKADRAIQEVTRFQTRLDQRAKRLRERNGELTEQQMFDVDVAGDLEEAIELFKDAKELDDVEIFDEASHLLYEFGDRGHRLWISFKND